MQKIEQGMYKYNRLQRMFFMLGHSGCIRFKNNRLRQQNRKTWNLTTSGINSSWQQFVKSAYRMRADNNGFTLLEILFSTLILSVAIISIASVFFQVMGYVRESTELSIISNSLQEEMELIRNMPFTQITSLPTSFTTSSFSNLTNPVGTVTVDNPLGISSLRRITLIISCQSLKGKTLTKRLTTYVTQNGINRK